MDTKSLGNSSDIFHFTEGNQSGAVGGIKHALDSPSLKEDASSICDKDMKSQIAKLGLIPSWMLTRTKMCKHKFSCYENVIISFYGIMVNSLAIKFFLSNIFLITNPRKLLKNIRNIKSTQDNFRFAFFAALMNAVYKLVLCLMRRFGISDKVNSLVAGFLAGLVSYFEVENRRNFIAGVLAGRMLDTVCTKGETEGYYKKLQYGDFWVFVISNWFMMYANCREDNIMSKPIAKKMREWGALTKNDKLM